MLCAHVTPEIDFWQVPQADIYGVSEIRVFISGASLVIGFAHHRSALE